MITLNIKRREKKENKKLKAEGQIPAVFYGKKEESTPISVTLSEFLKVWKEAGESTVVSLEGDVGKKEALIKYVDVDPVTSIPRHADFYVFETGHIVEVSVPIKFVGVAPAVKDMGGTLVKVFHEFNIKAQPKDLPHEIEVDISSLIDFDSQILVQDVKLPNGVEIVEKPKEAVVLVEDIKEEISEPQAEVDLSAIEVEKKGKKDVPAEAGDAKEEKKSA